MDPNELWRSVREESRIKGFTSGRSDGGLQPSSAHRPPAADDSDEDATSSPGKIVTSVVFGLGIFVLLSACSWAFDDRETCSEQARFPYRYGTGASVNFNHPESAFWGALASISDPGCKRDNPWAFWD